MCTECAKTSSEMDCLTGNQIILLQICSEFCLFPPDNNTETKEQQVKGVTKPKVTVKQEGQEFVINASDEIGLDKIEFILNGQGYLVRVEGATDKEFRYPLEQGDNTLEVTAYNVDGATGEFNAICHN